MPKQQKTILSNIDILQICNYLKIPIVDVFSKDELPSQKIKGLFVVNLGDSSTGGTHWCCMSTIPKNVFYFDSFGAPPSISIDKYIKKVTNKKRYFINKIQVQNLTGTWCGWVCIAVMWLMMYLKGSVAQRFDTICDWLNSDPLDLNYNKLVDFFKKILPTTEKSMTKN